MGKVFLRTANNKPMRTSSGLFLYYDPDAIVWHTLTEDDVTYLAQGGWNRTIIQAINTNEPNIIVPATLAGYPTYIDISIPNTVRRIKYESGTYSRLSIKASNNSTLLGVYNVPATVYTIELSNCTALKFIDLTNVTSVSSTFRISGCTALEELSEVNAEYSKTSLDRLWYQNKSGNIASFRIPDAVESFAYGLYDNGITSFTIDQSWDNLVNHSNALLNNPLTDLYFGNTQNTFDSAWINGGKEIDGSSWIDNISTDRTGNILNYSSYTAAPVTIHCAYGTAIYNKLRYAQATQNYMLRNLRLDLTDNHTIRQISFWGDSLTRRSENTTTQSNMVEHFYNWTADDVWCWNEGHGGAGSGTNFPNDYNSQQARWSDDVHVIWIGTNDTTLTEAQTIANIQTMITTCGFNNNYIVLQPFGWGYASGNESLYNAAFPGVTINTHKYILDNGFSVLGRTPTAEEQAQIDADTVPDVFVDTSDHTHITDSGGLVIATAVKEKLLELGYIDNSWLAV